MSPLKVQQAICTQLGAAHPVLLMQHLGIKTPKQLDQTSGRHHHIWGWRCTKKRIISPEDFNICLKSDDVKPECHSLLSLWVLYWARSCSKSSLMASGQRPATSLMALILEDKKAFKIHHSHHVSDWLSFLFWKKKSCFSPHSHDLSRVSVCHKVVGDGHDDRFNDLQIGKNTGTRLWRWSSAPYNVGRY